MSYDRDTIQKVASEILAKSATDEINKEIRRQSKFMRFCIGKAVQKTLRKKSFLNKIRINIEKNITDNIANNGFDDYVDDETWDLLKAKVRRILIK